MRLLYVPAMTRMSAVISCWFLVLAKNQRIKELVRK